MAEFTELTGNELKLIIVGMRYHRDQKYIDSIMAGDEFVLTREPKNPVDSLAVGMYDSKGKLVGYVRKEQAHRYYDTFEKPQKCRVLHNMEDALRVAVLDSVSNTATDANTFTPEERGEDLFMAIKSTSMKIHKFINSIFKNNELMSAFGSIANIIDSDKNPIEPSNPLYHDQLLRSIRLLIIRDYMTILHGLGHSHGNGDPEDVVTAYILIRTIFGQEAEYLLKGVREPCIAKITVNVMQEYIDDALNVAVNNYNEDDLLCFNTILKQFEFEQFATKYVTIMYRAASILAKYDGKVTDQECEWLKKMVRLQPKNQQHKAKKEVIEPVTPENAASSPLNELEELIGLSSVKESITKLRNFIQVQKMRQEKGLSVVSSAHHFVFTGNPGTGKTTVARILAGIYRDLHVIKNGHLVETDRSGLVAEYVGQTAVKTNKIIDKALDGVLFIDEAYSLLGGENDYGAEAVSTLLKRMEDDRDRLVVILAGYKNEMETFINSNPGLRSRFNRYIEFPDYSAEELQLIFEKNLKKYDYYLSKDAAEASLLIFQEAVSNKKQGFGNGRYVRNVFERTIENQCMRIADKKNITHEDLQLITADDLR